MGAKVAHTSAEEVATPYTSAAVLAAARRTVCAREGERALHESGGQVAWGAAGACTIVFAAGYVLKRLAAGARMRWRRCSPTRLEGAQSAPSAFD